MIYKVQHIANKRKIIRDMDPQSLTIHSTGNLKSTAQNERDNLNRPDNTSTTGFHIVVDDKEAIECIPLDKVAYHAGDGAYGPGNSTSIAMEICESGDRRRTLANAAKTAAKVLHERGWGVDKMYRHYDWSRKICPKILSDNNWEGWNKFKMEVQKELDKLKSCSKASNDKPSSWAKEAWEWAVKEGLLDGTNPTAPMTREMFAMVEYRKRGVK